MSGALAGAALASAPLAGAAPLGPAPGNGVSVDGIELLGAVELPTGFAFEGTTVGGLSGIVHDAATGSYLAISDDRSQIGPARFYELAIDLGDGSLDDGDVAFTGVTTLRRADGSTYPALSIDPEGIALGPDATVYVSSEGEVNPAAGRVQAPSVSQYRRSDGVLVSTLSTPSEYVPVLDGAGVSVSGIRNNLAFESLTTARDGKRLLTATENALAQDGPAASPIATSPSRILVFDDKGKVREEYRYDTDVIAVAPTPAGAFATNGLVELLALDDGRSFLALERSFSVGAPERGNDVHLYRVELDPASRLRPGGSLADVAPLHKDLVLDLGELDVPLDNLEGMTFGPVLADGRQSLVVVSDDNFNAAGTQSTQFLAFAVDVARLNGPPPVRFATFNASLNRQAAGVLVADLADTPDADAVQALRRQQIRNVAEVIQRTRPDVVLINEFDYVEGGTAVDLFRDRFLEVGQNGASPIEYPFSFVAPSNTGIPSGFDLDNNGTVAGGNDAFGFGAYPGQFGMVVLSRFPIDTEAVRTFQLFRWVDMPGNLIPQPYYSPDEVQALRLSSKSHWDVPIRVRGETVHLLASHPTPPVFDGVEDRNGRRNHDEIRFWADYVDPDRSGYVYDDEGVTGGLPADASFVIAGDQNADPLDGDSVAAAIDQLLDHPLVDAEPAPDSIGASVATVLQGGANATHRSDARYDTADFADTAPGNLRADYVLPSTSLWPSSSGVFWPAPGDPLARLTGTFDPAWLPVGGFPTSDHRLVWVDLRLS